MGPVRQNPILTVDNLTDSDQVNSRWERETQTAMRCRASISSPSIVCRVTSSGRGTTHFRQSKQYRNCARLHSQTHRQVPCKQQTANSLTDTPTSTNSLTESSRYTVDSSTLNYQEPELYQVICSCVWDARTEVKVKVKVWFLYSDTYMVDHEQRALTISEVAVDWKEPVVLQRKCGHLLPTLTDIGAAAAASKHTTAQINHTRPSPS